MNQDTSAVALADEITSRRRLELGKKLNRYPRRAVIMSDIGDCDRQMVYGVTHWEQRAMFNEDVQARLDIGNLMEKQIVRELGDLGFEVILSQQPVEIKDRNGKLLASGKIDGSINFKLKKIPIEVKSMNPNIFNAIKSLEDFRKKPWLRKYLRQMQMYLFGNNLDEGIFICTDCLGHWLILPVYLDYGECEHILQRLERANAHVEMKTLPDRIPYDDTVCGRCPFAHICLPDILNKPAEMLDNPQLVADIKRHEELKPLVAEYDDLHDGIKTTFKGIPKAIVGGEYLVQSVPTNRMTVELTEEGQAEVDALKAEIKVVEGTKGKKTTVEKLTILALDQSRKEQPAKDKKVA